MYIINGFFILMDFHYIFVKSTGVQNWNGIMTHTKICVTANL